LQQQEKNDRRRSTTAGVFAAAAALALVACGGERVEFEIPPPDFAADPVRGKRLYDASCAVCHGPGASGTQSGPPLVHKGYAPAHHADLAFYWAVRDGVVQHHWHYGNMPPVQGLSGEDVAHIIAYVRGLQREAGID
jgi:mono/diheme cytochrome c family protein